MVTIKKNIKIGSEADSIYIRFDDLSEEMKDYLRLFAAVESLKSGAPTNEKMFYEQFRKNYSDKLKNIFGKEFATAIKVVYQSRVSDEFMHCAEEKQLQYLQAFTDGYAKKIARGLDIMVFHGLDPKTSTSGGLLSDQYTGSSYLGHGISGSGSR